MNEQQPTYEINDEKGLSEYAANTEQEKLEANVAGQGAERRKRPEQFYFIFPNAGEREAAKKLITDGDPVFEHIKTYRNDPEQPELGLQIDFDRAIPEKNHLLEEFFISKGLHPLREHEVVEGEEPQVHYPKAA